MKILLSAGHGGTDSGSIGSDNGKEKDRTITLTNKVAALLRNAGHTVTVKQEKTSSGNWAMKNRTGYDYALSIHFNAFNGTATGVECLYKGTVKKATTMSKAVANAMGLKDRGAKSRPGLYMLNIGFDNLIEVCFHDNSSDLNKYNNNIDKVAKAIADTINGSSAGSSSSSNNSTSSNQDYTGKITYQSYDNVKKKWLPEVNSHDTSEYAGNLGNNMGGLRAKPTYGEIKIQVHIIGTPSNEWLDWVSSKNYKKNDKSNGNSYAGIYGKNIDKVRIISTKGYVDYRAYDNKKGYWLPWVRSTNVNEYAGNEGNPIGGIQMK